MKNLQLLFRKQLWVKPNPKFFTNNSEASKFFVSDESSIEGYNASDMHKLFDVDLSNPEFGIDAESLSIVGLQYMFGEEQICIAMRHGEIALLNLLDMSVESTGLFDCQLESMVWSPDQEIVLLVTNRGSVVMMSHDFDCLQEIEIAAEQFGGGDFVNVGWGSKETQFQGSAGKFVPGKTDQVEKSLFVFDDQLTKIAWRGDGQYFAVSNIANNQRFIRVWNRDGELQYTGEKLAGLESSLAWKPSGALLASTQRKVQRHDVVFFELNGLQHGEFTLPFETKQVNVTSLTWNSDSSLLMVTSKENSFDISKTFLQLWYCTNYHWTLKQHLEFTEEVRIACWDNEHPHSLHVILKNGLYSHYSWAWKIDVEAEILDLSGTESTNGQNTTSSYVAVVDVNSVKLSPFKVMSVPPPMCAYQLKLQYYVTGVCFCQSGKTQMGVLNSKGQFLTFCYGISADVSQHAVVELVCAGGKGFANRANLLELSCVYDLRSASNSFDWGTARHMQWIKTDLLIVAATKNVNCDCILFLALGDNNVQILYEVEMEGFISGISSYFDKGHCLQIVIQNHDGKLFYLSEANINPKLCSENFAQSIQLPCICPQHATCSFGIGSDNVSVGLLCLSPQKQLFLNGVMINSECSSFAIHDSFVLITTTSHNLIAISRETSIEKLLGVQSKPVMSNTSMVMEMSRSVERGSTIVTVTPHDTKVVLQMPRGNLEIIHPRPLVLSALKVHLDSCAYDQAFTIMRKHRINMNLFHDHDPSKFCNEISQFVEQLGSSDFLNIFISELREENVTLTLYKQYYSVQEDKSNSLLAEKSSKVDKICDLIMTKIRNVEKYLLSVLTAHVRKSKPEIDAALTKVKQLKDSSSQLANEALKHLHVMVDGRILYQEALATYDLELALMVAQVSNDDPKEYIPFLNELKELENNYMKYKIDMFLKKYPSALVNIAKCPEHLQECIDLVKSHDLYREALKAFGKYTEPYRVICKLYAENLVAKHKFEEAGIILLRCNLHKRAMKCFVEGCHWQHALNCAVALQYSETDYCALASTLAQKLSEKNKQTEAAHIFVAEAKDIPSAVTVLVKAHKWQDALQLIYKHKLTNQIDTHIAPSLKEAADSLTSTLQTHRENFDRYYNRLIKVRELKKERHLRMLMTGEDDYLESDIASDLGSTITSSSQGSRASRMSGRSSKTRRKQQRNKYSLREGSRFEEEGLLQALQSLIKQCLLVKEEVHSLVSHLALFFMDEDASGLQKLYTDTVGLLSRYTPQIWTLPDMQMGDTGPQSTVQRFLQSMVDDHQGSFNSSDLEIFIPPKVDCKELIGLHLYS